ncbi:dTDP-4-dehydrorhamnose 3,5-epimerase [Mesorhizobium sp. M8A.F.Ca.ET.165.01.1.1]|uniref:dTDP-4-dehydrorhamnose 3,5-epimerase n=1 Tax=Mesorhizobium sp. M8A.F.Ca.ET.165.01.1.1 TaxID=2563960 RepID=UPI000FD514E8|nr:dTDP-4-dehydrorhamnose 3,5-epimerase [Mesorhizobium sp. M8A.F.Ca.ET.165.01.1.1]RUW92028.1 dTDP-4-dehydrorhamnose 3,5-epimerase [Mesorhizobium sp. M8A.F.Ca.ET.059.01.1.1]RWC69427.1 MAG: dTDP-4-dehydrorhamnose 3,5-epimerase [Mesorhizobium sp.]TGV13724.1 dTDP-4-dehydrorhamnose 3,5-epimerase [Mesorhizobium sp. M8A.F.Ca.ET.173.01.1.1]TGT41338.1 dTDP-4-dehydrorhamnose 3,5-epimerase [Mesorhizobium sp. M8A.F.Ca.ET.165.01.1.1]TIT64574.1 MAG: dTDP-4-dehydrorhamnose 3,5-epimerase [Mesorhizobium sp.]
MLEVRSLGIDGVLEIVPKRHGDARGFFMETYNAERFSQAGIDLTFVQDNHSYSAAPGVLRGLHYQLAPRAQDKLLRVIRGSILDIAVDIRRASKTFGKWVALEVSAEKGNQILVPKGFAHGFVTLVPDTEVLYKVTDTYSPEHDRSIRFDDPAIGIEWPSLAGGFQLSDKDLKAPTLATAEVFA